NKNLSTPITIDKINVSWFEDFPNLSIVFNGVYIEDSHPGQYPLLTADVISFQLNALEVWRGQYTIKGMQIRNTETTLQIDKGRKNNYAILNDNTTAGDAGSLTFVIKNVKLVDTRVRYCDIEINEDLSCLSDERTASVDTRPDIYNILAEGDVTTEKLKV